MSVCMCQRLRMNIFTDMFSGCSDIFKKLNSQLHFCILSQTYFRRESWNNSLHSVSSQFPLILSQLLWHAVPRAAEAVNYCSQFTVSIAVLWHPNCQFNHRAGSMTPTTPGWLCLASSHAAKNIRHQKSLMQNLFRLKNLQKFELKLASETKTVIFLKHRPF